MLVGRASQDRATVVAVVAVVAVATVADADIAVAVAVVVALCRRVPARSTWRVRACGRRSRSPK